jgi:hypothetical protein
MRENESDFRQSFPNWQQLEPFIDHDFHPVLASGDRGIPARTTLTAGERSR